MLTNVFSRLVRSYEDARDVDARERLAAQPQVPHTHRGRGAHVGSGHRGRHRAGRFESIGRRAEEIQRSAASKAGRRGATGRAEAGAEGEDGGGGDAHRAGEGDASEEGGRFGR